MLKDKGKAPSPEVELELFVCFVCGNLKFWASGTCLWCFVLLLSSLALQLFLGLQVIVNTTSLYYA
jgi:hypothetical protein